MTDEYNFTRFHLMMNSDIVENFKILIPELKPFSEETIEELYCEFSNYFYCAGFIENPLDRIQEFKKYLFTNERPYK